jgi:hypothetical protein
MLYSFPVQEYSDNICKETYSIYFFLGILFDLLPLGSNEQKAGYCEGWRAGIMTSEERLSPGIARGLCEVA